MVKEREFYSEDRKLYGILQLPEDESTKKYPIVILCHGHSRHCNDGLDQLAEELQDARIASFRFNFSGCSSKAEKRYSLYCSSQWIKDLISAISYVESLPEIDSARIGTAGISMGATTSVAVSGLDKRIRCNVAMAPIDDCGKWLKGVWEKSEGKNNWDSFVESVKEDSIIHAATGKSKTIKTLEMYNDTEENIENHRQECLNIPENNFYVTLDSVADLFSYYPINYCSAITIPTFILYGEEDNLVPYYCGRNILDASNAAVRKLSRYPGIDHNIPFHPKREMAFSDVINWFNQYL